MNWPLSWTAGSPRASPAAGPPGPSDRCRLLPPLQMQAALTCPPAALHCVPPDVCPVRRAACTLMQANLCALACTGDVQRAAGPGTNELLCVSIGECARGPSPLHRGLMVRARLAERPGPACTRARLEPAPRTRRVGLLAHSSAELAGAPSVRVAPAALGAWHMAAGEWRCAAAAPTTASYACGAQARGGRGGRLGKQLAGSPVQSSTCTPGCRGKTRARVGLRTRESARERRGVSKPPPSAAHLFPEAGQLHEPLLLPLHAELAALRRLAPVEPVDVCPPACSQ